MYEKPAAGWLKHFDFMFLDIVCLKLSFLLSYFIRVGFTKPFEQAVYRGMFKHIFSRGYYQEFISTLRHTILITSLAAPAPFHYKNK